MIRYETGEWSQTQPLSKLIKTNCISATLVASDQTTESFCVGHYTILAITKKHTEDSTVVSLITYGYLAWSSLLLKKVRILQNLTILKTKYF